MPTRPPEVLIIMGSENDFSSLKQAWGLLDSMGINVQVRVASVHRTPERLFQLIEETNANGCKVIIAAAGKAAALPGIIATCTCLPVIGVPIAGSQRDTDAAVYSMLQMPNGYPVATFSPDAKHGAINAALHAASIIALGRPEIRIEIATYRKAMASKIRMIPKELLRQCGN